MINLVLGIHVMASLLLILIVLMQSAKGGGLGGAFGGVTETAFGARAGTFLTRFTTTLAILFMITSLSLAVLSFKKRASVMAQEPAVETIPEEKKQTQEEASEAEVPGEEAPESK